MEEKIYNWLKDRLSEKRFKHSIGSEKTARELAIRFKFDPEKAAFAALLHDNAKNFSIDELLEMIEKYNIEVSNEELNSPKTLHSPVGAYLAQKELGIDDEDTLNAIRFHTIGRTDMSLLEKIVFLADKIEENTRHPEFTAKIKNILNETGNIDEALIICYENTIKSLIDRRLVINIQTITVYNSLLKSLT